MGHDHQETPESIAQQSKKIWTVGAILGVATVFTVWIAGVDLGSHALNITVGLLVAAIKAGLVALIFMHLNHERGIVYKVLFFTVVFAIGLFALTWLGFVDPLISKTIGR